MFKYRCLLGMIFALALLVVVPSYSHGNEPWNTQPDSIYSLARTADLIAVGYGSGRVEVRDVATQRLLFEPPDFDLRFPMYDLHFSSDGSHLAVISASAWVLEIPTGEILMQFDSGTSSTELSWSPDGSLLAIANHNGRGPSATHFVRIWSIQTEEPVGTLMGHTNYIGSVSWSPDGSLIATGSGDKTLRIWDAETFENIQTIQTDTINTIDWSPDVSHLVTGSADTTATLWNTGTWQPEGVVNFSSQVMDVSWQLISSYVAITDQGGLWLWNIEDRSLMQVENATGNSSVVWSPDGTQLTFVERKNIPITINVELDMGTSIP